MSVIVSTRPDADQYPWLRGWFCDQTDSDKLIVDHWLWARNHTGFPEAGLFVDALFYI